jgi:hypothetical protein
LFPSFEPPCQWGGGGASGLFVEWKESLEKRRGMTVSFEILFFVMRFPLTYRCPKGRYLPVMPPNHPASPPVDDGLSWEPVHRSQPVHFPIQFPISRRREQRWSQRVTKTRRNRPGSKPGPPRPRKEQGWRDIAVLLCPRVSSRMTGDTPSSTMDTDIPHTPDI